MVQEGSQLSEWTEGLGILAMLWQWPQGSNYLSGQKVWGSLQCFGNGRRVYNYLSEQKVWGLLLCFFNGRKVHNYLRGQKVWGLLRCFGNGRRVHNYLSGQKVWGPMQYFGNGRFKLRGESVSFRMTKPVQHRSQFSTSEQMSHSNADQCVLWYLPLPLCNCFSEVVVSIWNIWNRVGCHMK